jgi:hypothetical protein
MPPSWWRSINHHHPDGGWRNNPISVIGRRIFCLGLLDLCSIFGYFLKEFYKKVFK